MNNEIYDLIVESYENGDITLEEANALADKVSKEETDKEKKKSERKKKLKQFAKDHKKSLAYAGLLAATTAAYVKGMNGVYTRGSQAFDDKTSEILNRNRDDYYEATEDSSEKVENLEKKMDELEEKKRKKEKRKKRLIGAGIVAGSTLARNAIVNAATKSERENYKRSVSDFATAATGENSYYDM